MKFGEIKKLDLEDYYWWLVYGRSRRRATFFELRSTGFKELPAPVFFLSTGRCGTNWMADLLAHDKTLKVFHEPKPNLGVQGKKAYQIYSSTDFSPAGNEELLLEEIVLAAREQYLRYAYKTQRRFVETNNQITFLAPAIFRLFPDAKFVHLNRHPGEFVRSALRRNFYNNVDDIKRIIPAEGDPIRSSWNKLTLLEKNSWLWTATNAFIHKFKSQIPAENQFYFNFNQLDEDNITRLCKFLDVSIPGNKVRKMLHQPVNVQRQGNVGGYASWPDEEKESLKRICGDLATTYDYQL